MPALYPPPAFRSSGLGQIPQLLLPLNPSPLTDATFPGLNTSAISFWHCEFVTVETLICATELIEIITVKLINFGTTLNCACIHVLTLVNWEICAFSNMSAFHWSLGTTDKLASDFSLFLFIIVEFGCYILSSSLQENNNNKEQMASTWILSSSILDPYWLPNFQGVWVVVGQTVGKEVAQTSPGAGSRYVLGPKVCPQCVKWSPDLSFWDEVSKICHKS